VRIPLAGPLQNLSSKAAASTDGALPNVRFGRPVRRTWWRFTLMASATTQAYDSMTFIIGSRVDQLAWRITDCREVIAVAVAQIERSGGVELPVEAGIAMTKPLKSGLFRGRLEPTLDNFLLRGTFRYQNPTGPGCRCARCGFHLDPYMRGRMSDTPSYAKPLVVGIGDVMWRAGRSAKSLPPTSPLRQR